MDYQIIKQGIENWKCLEQWLGKGEEYAAAKTSKCEPRTCGQVASQIGKPNAMCAAGGANAQNRLSTVCACRRATGKLTGFAGGMENKVLLLELEGNYRGERQK